MSTVATQAQAVQAIPLPTASAAKAKAEPRNRITYMHGIALKERGVILHGLAALARQEGVPESGRAGLNSSRREKLLGLIALLLRTEERGQVLKSSYGTLAAKLETSESTLKDLLNQVSSLGLYTMQFDRKAQMWEIYSGPALEPQAWIALLNEGQKHLGWAVNANVKENDVWCGYKSWQEPRRYPARRQYEKTKPVVVQAVLADHPGELQLGANAPEAADPRPTAGAVRMDYPGEVHLGIGIHVAKSKLNESLNKQTIPDVAMSRLHVTTVSQDSASCSYRPQAQQEKLDQDGLQENESDGTNGEKNLGAALRFAPRHEHAPVKSNMTQQRRTVYGVTNPLNLADGDIVEAKGQRGVVSRYDWDCDEYLITVESSDSALVWFSPSQLTLHP